MNYYNDNDPRCAAWLRELIQDGLIPPGDVDERSIVDVTPDDLAGYTQAHFFAGIGGWPLALQLAGWTGPVWTGSAPCQPFSCAGARKGEKDERHLWPEFYRLIRECRPPVVFGEQVEGAVKLGWIDRVQADLEAEGYACGYTVLGAHSVGAPHRRQRLYWVGRLEDAMREGSSRAGAADNGEAETNNTLRTVALCRVADASNPRRAGTRQHDGGSSSLPARPEQCGEAGGLAHPDGRFPCDGDLQRSGQHGEREEDGGAGGGMDLPDRERCNGQPIHLCGGEPREAMPEAAGAGAPNFWSHSVWIHCRDGRARRVEPSIFPLADGVPGRVGLLRGAGNAIVPEVAAEFIKAYLEVTP